MLDEIERVHGPVARLQVFRELRRPRTRARPKEAERAARTLPLRATETPLRLFRHLFSQACSGDLLCDASADAERVRAAELEERLRDPDYAAAHPQAGPAPPDPLLDRVLALQARVRLVAATHPHRAAWVAELAELERQLAVRPARPPRPKIQPPTRGRGASEFGGRTGLVVRVGVHRMVVHRGMPEAELGDRELERRLAALDVDALDRDELPERGPC